MADDLKAFIPITKVNAERREVWGVLAEEAVDKSGEIMDYETSKPNFEAWANQFSKATEGKSMGNLRAMHGNVAAGKLVSLEADDAAKKILIGAKVVDDGEWNKVLEGVYTGFSVGGSYAKRWHDPALNAKRYTALPAEASLVDNPCMYGAQFEVVKADGVAEMRKFVGDEGAMDKLAKLSEHLQELGKLKTYIQDLAKAGARHSASDNTLIQEIHDAGCALGAQCASVEKMTKSYDEEPAWVAWITGLDIGDTATALAFLSELAGRLIERSPDAAAKISAAAQIIADALKQQTDAQSAAITAAVTDAMTDEALLTEAGLERIAGAVMRKLAEGEDAPLNKINGQPADVLKKADIEPLNKSLDEVAAQTGALGELVVNLAKRLQSFGPIVRELPGNPSGPSDELATLDKLIAGEPDMAQRQYLMNKRAQLAIHSVHSNGGNVIR